MTSRLDLNADLGEHDGPPPPAARALLRVVTSVNVACGWHAGDQDSMRGTAAEALRLGVQLGAHPSYPDREGFGRRALPMTPAEITDAVTRQIDALCEAARLEGAVVAHVKPHGALYNVAWRDARVAAAIVAAVASRPGALAMYAPERSALAAHARACGVRVVSEGFVDRAYEDDGTLTPRGMAGAVLHDAAAASRRAVEWARTGCVRARSGVTLAMPIETLCVHGDTPEAAAIAAGVRSSLESAGVLCLPSLTPRAEDESRPPAEREPR